MHRQILFAAILGAHPAGQLKLFKLVPKKLWEGWFKSQALLDKSAVLACMVYVDLNPIRAMMAKRPETSNHTSIVKRTHAVKQKTHQPQQLMSFVGNPRQNMHTGIHFSLKDYCELVDTNGRVIREVKAGYINHHFSPILSRLGLCDEQWLSLTTEFKNIFVMPQGQSK